MSARTKGSQYDIYGFWRLLFFSKDRVYLSRPSSLGFIECLADPPGNKTADEDEERGCVSLFYFADLGLYVI